MGARLDGARERLAAAQQIALVEIVQQLILSTNFTRDRTEFRHRLRRLEAAAVTGIRRRATRGGAITAEEASVNEAAAETVRHLIAAVRHPGDPPIEM